ncbi:diguanylate cyclase regulator RdcB family protein [uncultured Thiodictyon sp.]|uniref:diguanylate cyclase regulator RdcB family protein n=1 Tax=uncultured Thiodictyon sp. TaxID=1846217 RepID=UPI0025EC4003|nr:diguanylate cyclase regulator RdcB family protein [uncultured Thiodictyon sp.]
MNTLLPIAADAEICKILQCLPEKFVVDFANGIDVAHDHIRVQHARSGFGARLYDGFTGRDRRRQTEINASLIDGVEASIKWLNELSMSLAKSNLALTQVKNRIAMIQGAFVKLANHSADTRQQLEALSLELARRCRHLEQEIMRVDSVQRANIHIDLVFSKWEAGRFASFSLSGRCYAALEELRWGAFGDFFRDGVMLERSTHLEILRNRAIIQLAKDARNTPTSRIDIRQWFNQPTGRGVLPDATGALAYMGDWSRCDQEPFVYASLHFPDDLPLPVPRICSAERLTEALVAEVFGEY